jgi:hypothetical protein
MVDGEEVAALVVVDTSPGAVGCCKALRQFAYPALEQVAHLGQQEAHSSLGFGSLRYDIACVAAAEGTNGDVTGTSSSHPSSISF